MKNLYQNKYFLERKIKFRFFCPPASSFVEQYNYNGAVDDLFNYEDPTLVPSQYIGIEDINKKEVYEGDIITYQNSFNEAKKAVIQYRFTSFVAKLINAQSTLDFLFIHDLGPAVEVIGNIFENPDLI